MRLSYTRSGGAEAARGGGGVQCDHDGDERISDRDDRAAAGGSVVMNLLTRLIEAEVEGEKLTQEEILGFFQLLIVAGQETTTNLINNAVVCLMEHPAELARLRATPNLLPSMIEEVLRYRSPIQWMMRKPKKAVEMHGQLIPAGALVLPDDRPGES